MSSKNNHHLQVVPHKVNMGLGTAMNTGFKTIIKKAADNDLVVAMDADNTHEVSTIRDIVAKYREGYDLVLTSRFVSGGGDQGISPLRRLLSHSAGLVFKIIFPIRGVREYTSSYRGYRAALLKQAYRKFGDNFIREKGFNCMLEILVKLARLSPKIIEVPTKLYYDRKKGKSKMDVKKTLWRYLLIAANRQKFVE